MVGRILALDPGERRMGVALSDETGLIAQPLETHRCTSLERDVAHVRDLVHRHAVREVVVGVPVQMDGRPGPTYERVRTLMDRLEQVLEVPVVGWDERLTSKAAERLLIEADVSREKRKDAVDRVAAAILLQSYLDRLSVPGGASDGEWTEGGAERA